MESSCWSLMDALWCSCPENVLYAWLYSKVDAAGRQIRLESLCSDLAWVATIRGNSLALQVNRVQRQVLK